MSKVNQWGLAIVLSGTMFLASCASPGYVKYVKPITSKVWEYTDKVGATIDRYRDPTCITADCQWQRDADENAE